MTDLLHIGARSLMNIQHAINTTGHNIANVNTEGYSRQRVIFESAGYQQYGFGFLGQGANIASVERAYNSFLANQVQNFASTKAQFDMQHAYVSRLDDIMASADNSLNNSLQQFFNAVNEVSANPAGIAERQVLLSETKNLVSRQQSLNRLFNDLNQEVNTEIKAIVGDINRLGDNLSRLNREIVSAYAAGNGALPNDLLDRRDNLLRELATRVSIETATQSDGSVNVFVGKGQPLVVGGEATHLQTQRNPHDSNRLEIGVAGQPPGSNITRFLQGGQLQGLLDFRDGNLARAQSEVGLLMLNLTEAFNEQHGKGFDLDGNMGGNFFDPVNIQPRGSSNNQGDAQPAVSLVDATQLRASDYRLSYDGSDWTLTRLSDNTSVTGAAPLSLDGMTVTVPEGDADSGDSFLLTPGRDALSGFSLAIDDGRKFAAAAAVTLNQVAGNGGNAALQNLHVTDASVLPLAAPLTLTFLADADGDGNPGFQVNGDPDDVLLYDPATDSGGMDFDLNGLGFRISGTPQEGDSFTLDHNNGARGDNNNALALAGLQQKQLLNGGSDTLQEYYGAIVAEVGISTRQASANRDVETAMFEQAMAYRDSVSGVNLDEEASNMMRLQQSYQAMAQLIRIANETFQTLINSFG